MKLTIVLLTATFLNVHASGFSQNVTLSVKDFPLKKIFTVIEAQTEFLVAYNEDIFKNTKPVTLSVNDLPLKEVLDIVLKDQPIKYRFEGKTIFLSRKETLDHTNSQAVVVASDQQLPITGRITDAEGKPLEGATVTVKKSKASTVTNADGLFSLNANEGDILIFSYVGYSSIEIKISSPTSAIVMAADRQSSAGRNGKLISFGPNGLSISLNPSAAKLENVVVTVDNGYEKISKERFVGSFSKLDSGAYHRRIGMDIITRLDGTVPGVLLDKKGSAGIQVRGISTLQGSFNQPLIILDNFPFNGNLNNINPNDILDITILKDAAAASVWGTLAGNGVIVITTKKGKFNQPLQVSATSNLTLQDRPNLYYYPRMSSSDFIDVEKYLFDQGYYDESLNNTTNRPVLSPVVEVLGKLRSGTITQAEADQQINSYKGLDIRNDLDNYVYGKSFSQQHYINVNGGTNLISYNFSAGYNRSMPNIKGSSANNQYTINSVTVFRPLKNFEFETGVNLTKTIDKAAVFSLPSLYPYAQIKDDQGNSLAVPKDIRLSYADTTGEGQLLDWHYRPFDEIGLTDNTRTIQFSRLNLRAAYRFTNWLKAEIRYQYTNQNSDQRNYQSLQTYFTRNLINEFTQFDGTNITNVIPRGGILDIGNSSSNVQNVRTQINFNKKWRGDHDLSAFVAGELSESKSTASNTRFYGYDDLTGGLASSLNFASFYPQYGTGNTATIPDVNGIAGGVNNRLISLIANASYSYKYKYVLYGSARRDGSNVFGVNTNNKWKPLWSAGGGWDIFKEPFYHLNWLPNLRLRASYGFMGNINNTLSGQPTILYTGSAPYTNLIRAQVGNAPNPDLRWEQVETGNVGVDFGIFNNRISGSVDWFHKKSTDLISSIPFDPTTGVDQYIVNAASLKGNGFEWILHSQNTRGAVKWNTDVSLSYAKMIVTHVYDGRYRASDFVNYAINAYPGNVAYGIYSYRWAGLDPTTGDPQGYLNKIVSKDYVGILNDSLQNTVFNGSSIPLYSGFISNSVKWKQISISANITYRFNFYFRKPTISYSELFRWTNLNADYNLRWKNTGNEMNTTVPSLSYPADNNRDEFYQNSEVNILRGDNIRLQDLQLQYELNKEAWNKLPVKHIRLIFYANNLNIILWRKNKMNMDPDFTAGTNFTVAPIPRTWTFGVNMDL